MSVYPRIADAPPTGAEARHMTQSVNCESFGFDRNGLVSPPNPGLETIRNQTLSRAITDHRASHHGGSNARACFGGFEDVGGAPGECRVRARRRSSRRSRLTREPPRQARTPSPDGHAHTPYGRLHFICRNQNPSGSFCQPI